MKTATELKTHGVRQHLIYAKDKTIVLAINLCVSVKSLNPQNSYVVIPISDARGSS